jgi:hypothetical protein
MASHAAASPLTARQVVRLVQTHIPWDHLTSTLWLNRTIFLLLAMLCVTGTIAGLQRQRQGSYPHAQRNHKDSKKWSD